MKSAGVGTPDAIAISSTIFRNCRSSGSWLALKRFPPSIWATAIPPPCFNCLILYQLPSKISKIVLTLTITNLSNSQNWVGTAMSRANKGSKYMDNVTTAYTAITITKIATANNTYNQNVLRLAAAWY